MAEFSYSSPAKIRKTPKAIRRRRLLLFVPIILLILLFLYIIGYRAGIQQREARDYLGQTNRIALKSNKVAKIFKNRLKKPLLKTDTSSLAELADMLEESTNLSDQAQNMIVPERFQQVHSYFIMTMKLRNKGMIYYKAVISNKTKSPKTSKKKFEEAVKYLKFSDLAYKTYTEELTNIIKEDKVKIKIVKSQFISPNSNLYKLKNVKTKKKQANEEINSTDIAIDDVATEPLRISINTNTQVRVLPLSNSINVRIRVKNNSNKDLNNIPVEVELVTAGKTSGEKKQGMINKISANSKAKVTIRGFSPYKNMLNIFKIKIGPNNGKNNSNNYYEYKFILRDMSNEVNNTPQGGGQNSQSQPIN